MLLSGLMICNNEYELEMVLKKLKEVRNAQVTVQGLSVVVDYEPADTETSFEEEETIAKITDILESVELHGFSMTR